MIVATLPGRPLAGQLTYVESDFAFRFVPAAPDEISTRAPSGTGSLLLGTLQIEVSSSSGELLYAWGYCPRQAWRTGNVVLPDFIEGRLVVDQPPPPGVGVEPSTRLWVPLFDPESGVVQLSSQPKGEQAAGAQESVLIASGVVVGHRDGQIEEVWLNPESLD